MKNQDDNKGTLFRSASAVWFVVGILVLINIVTAALYLNERGNTIERILGEYPLIDPSRHFIAQENFITNIQPLRETLYAIMEKYELTTASVYFEVLSTGANVSINPDTRVYPASLLKAPTAIAVMKKIENDEWRLDNKLVLFASDIDPNYGTRYVRNSIGTTFTIEELLKAILIESDNTTHRILLRNMSTEDLAFMRDGMGIGDILDENQRLSAKEYSRVFRALYYSSFLKRENSQKLLEWMSETLFDDFLQPGIPASVRFSHKIGEDGINNTYLDSGIVYVPNRPYILTVAIAGRTEKEAKAIMREVSQAAYDYVTSY